MQKLTRLAQFTPTEILLLLKSSIWIIATRIALGLLPFKTVRTRMAKWGKSHNLDELSSANNRVEKIIWAVELSSRYLLPQSPCLTKALVAQMMLSQQGYATLLRIGVARNPDGTLQAHAWLEREGEIMVGYLHNMQQFTPLPPLVLDEA